MQKKDFLIVLAWPEGMVEAPGSWYDKIFSKNNKYRVGHSAIILVDSVMKQLHYFDFGRYHSPIGFGRIRDLETDPDVKIKIVPKIENRKISNIKDVLKEIKNNKALHGSGTLYASILNNISFKKAHTFAKREQEKGLIKYGPFIRKGSNCSRFVSAVMRNSKTSFFKNIRLKFPISLSPSPKRNVGIANSNFYKINDFECIKIKRTKIESYLKSIER